MRIMEDFGESKQKVRVATARPAAKSAQPEQTGKGKNV